MTKEHATTKENINTLALIQDFCEQNKLSVDKAGFNKILALGDDYLRILLYRLIDFNRTNKKDLSLEIGEKRVLVYAEKEEVKNSTEPTEVTLPGLGKLISEFAYQVVDVLKEKDTLFFRVDSREIIEIGKIKLNISEDEVYTGFVNVKPNRFITLAEKYFTPGINIWNEYAKEFLFKKKSMGSDLANTLLSSEILQKGLYPISRIFTIPIPILYNGELTFPKNGYDNRFNSWLPSEAPQIINQNMSLEEAKNVIDSILKEFCFQGTQDYHNAIAALITPFLRGIFPTFNTRTPVFFYLGNRERVGKDYLAGVTGILYEGHALEESPISTNENAKSNNTEELRKKLLSSFLAGRKRIHFSNNKGYINNAVFESVVTAEKYSDRILGKNEVISFDNELDFSLSGNVGVGYTPDFANRARFIRLFLDIEDANSRKFNNPNLHSWVNKNRGLILSALYALVKNWFDKGKPAGTISFASFPQWAEICGGIMEAANYGNPCIPDIEVLSFGGDNETNDMKQLFELAYENYGEKWIPKKLIKEIVLEEDCNLFDYLDFSRKQDQTKFGNKIIKFVGRILSEIMLEVQDPKVRASRQVFRFTKITKEGNIGIQGNRIPQSTRENQRIYTGGILLPSLPPLPEFTNENEKLDIETIKIEDNKEK